MSNKQKAYVAFVIALGIGFITYTAKSHNGIDISGVLLFTALSIIAESLVIITPGDRALSVGFAIGLAAIVVFGIPEAAWITGLGVMLRSATHDGKRRHILNNPPYKTLFNGSNAALSAGLSGLCYVRLGGVPGTIDLNSTVLAIVACIIVYIFVNAIIMSILMHLITGEGFLHNFFGNIVWVVKDYFSMAPIGIIMAIAYINYGLIGVLLFFLPLLFARYSFKLYVDMRKIYIDTVKSLSQAVEAKDPYTNGHSMRVAKYSCRLAERLELPEKRIQNLKIAAELHDIGKIGIEEGILNKPGRLNEMEYDKIKQHPEIGVKIIKDISFLKEASKIILYHHERYDGTGYPEGRKNDDIILESQILSLADVFDALTSKRPYRDAMTVEEALEIIENGKGSQFEGELAEAFISMIKEEKELVQLAD